MLRGIEKRLGAVPHVCTSACETVPLRVHVHTRDGKEYARWSLCNEPWMNESNFVRALRHVFVCKSSKTVHQCTRECPLPKVCNDDFTLCCPVSGVQWDNATEVSRSWKLTSKCLPTITHDKRDPNMFSRDASGRVRAGTLNIHEESCRRELSEVLNLLVCSSRRRFLELDRFRVNRQRACKAVNKYVKFARGDVVNMCVVRRIYTSETRRRLFLRDMPAYAEMLPDLAARIYPSVIRVWNLTNKKSFRLFVVSLLYLMQRGLRMDGEVLLRQVPEFDDILPDANVLDKFDVQKSLFTQTKNNIRACLRG